MSDKNNSNKDKVDIDDLHNILASTCVMIEKSKFELSEKFEYEFFLYINTYALGIMRGIFSCMNYASSLDIDKLNKHKQAFDEGVKLFDGLLDKLLTIAKEDKESSNEKIKDEQLHDEK